MEYWDANSTAQYFANTKGIKMATLNQVITDYDVQKTSGTVTSALSPEYRNYVYGMRIVENINTESNVIGMMPKSKWKSSGLRVRKAVSTAATNGVIAETGNATTRAYPDIAYLQYQPRIFYKSFDITEIEQDLAIYTMDDALGAEQVRDLILNEYSLHLSTLAVSKAIASYGESAPTLNTNAFTSLDRICASSVEAGLYSSSGNEDIYNLDRSTDTWANAVVKYGATTGVGQDLSFGLINETINAVRKAGGMPTIMYMGYDNYGILAATATVQQRLSEYPAKASPQGAQIGASPIGDMGAVGGNTQTYVPDGYNAGVEVAAMFNKVAIIPTQHETAEVLASDAGTATSRIFMLDTTTGRDIKDEEARISFSLARPPEYLESGPGMVGLYDNGQFFERALVRGWGDIKTTFPAVQAKIRDLKAPF
jgi:hypothetical protein